MDFIVSFVTTCFFFLNEIILSGFSFVILGWRYTSRQSSTGNKQLQGNRLNEKEKESESLRGISVICGV